MSKLSKELVKQGMCMYRRILKAHSRCLGGEVQKFGNQYVKEEFNLHIKKATPEQFGTFLKSWEQYADFMEKSKMKKVQKSYDMKTKNVPKPLEQKLDDNQKRVLEAFKQAIYAMKNMRKAQQKPEKKEEK